MTRPLSYYTYQIPNNPTKGVLVTTEPPESVKRRFKFGEYNLTMVNPEQYQEALKATFKTA